jgi:putative hydrolase of the HAD superfamily
MLNDIWPAQNLGFRTALFAGDLRSYRPRKDDPRVQGLQPDLVLGDLSQLEACVLPG